MQCWAVARSLQANILMVAAGACRHSLVASRYNSMMVHLGAVCCLQILSFNPGGCCCCCCSHCLLCWRSVTHVVSQSDVLMFLHKHVDELGPLGDVTLQQLGLATKPVVCVPAEMSTIKAFASMVVSGGMARLGILLGTALLS